MAKCWGSKLSPFHWVEFLYCTIGLKTRRDGGRLRASVWLYYHANIVPKLGFAHHCQLFSFIPHLLPSGTYHQHLWSICAIYVSQISLCFKSSMCLCFTLSYWVLANRLNSRIPQIPLEASDKGKCELRRGLSVLTAVCRIDGLRWMLERQTDIKKQMAFMSSKIYPLNKLCWALPAEFMALDTRNRLSALSLDVWQRSMVLSHQGSMKY